jgi:predicted Zn-ribbon and HTH transcriptional regulator
MENIRVLGEEHSTADIEVIKAKREAFIKEYVKNMRDLRAKGKSLCGIILLNNYKCNNCNAVFISASIDAKLCPTCGGSDLKEISDNEIRAHRVDHRIIDMIGAVDKAEIKMLWSQKIGKKAIAEKLRISICEVSDVIGTTKRPLPQEKIDFIRNEYLSGHQEWEIMLYLDRVSVERIHEVIRDLHNEIEEACDQGTRPEDIGKIIGIHGHDQAIIEIANRFIKSEAYLRDIESRCTEPIGEL